MRSFHATQLFVLAIGAAAVPLNADRSASDFVARGPFEQSVEPDYAAEKQYLQGLQQTYISNTRELLKSNQTSGCRWENISIRRAWDDLSRDERADYIRAVKCMATLPSRTDPSEVPGARNWIDDFVWAHIAQTNYIHVSGLLLPWHRQFIWSWEQSLRNQCGYQGFLPYWPWERHAHNQSQSPVFQPDMTSSFGTDGAFVPHGETAYPLINVPDSLNVTRAPGTGGGCVTDGAFGTSAGWTLNIGLVTPVNDTVYGSNNTLYPNNTLGQQYSPRCLKRDWLQSQSTLLLNYTNVAYLMRQESIHTFRPVLDNDGTHIGGHFFVGGDGVDIYASPNEPTFYLHHANLDRLWTIWQAQNFAERAEALDGTVTIRNSPPSENATLDTIMRMGIPAGGDLPIRHAMSATGNDYCYVYM